MPIGRAVVWSPCVLRHPALTRGRLKHGGLRVAELRVVLWRQEGRQAESALVSGPLSPVAVDNASVAFQAEGGRIEVRLHPDEAPHILRALAAAG